MSGRSCPLCGSDAAESAENCKCGYKFTTAAPAAMADTPQAVEAQALEARSNPWPFLGWLLLIGGLCGLAIGFNMKMTIDSYAASGILGGVPSEIVNLDLLFRKGMTIAGSLAATGIGVVCLGVNSILNAIDARAG